MNVTKAVESRIAAHPSVQDCLRKRLLNYSALSRLLLRELSLPQEHFAAVLIAARRYAWKLEKKPSREDVITDILRQSSLDIKNRMVVAVTSKAYASSLAAIERKAQQRQELFYLIEGTVTVTAVTTAVMLADIRKVLGRRLLGLSQHLALVTLTSPKAVETTPGVLAALANAFADNDINIVETMSCWTDTLFVVEEADIAKVLALLSSYQST